MGHRTIVARRKRAGSASDSLLVAQQIGGVIIVPIIGVTLLQATGTLLVGASGYLVLAAIVLVVSLIGLRIGVALFDREAILTRWR